MVASHQKKTLIPEKPAIHMTTRTAVRRVSGLRFSGRSPFDREAGLRGTRGSLEFRSKFSETLTRSEKTIYAG
jgi:hypothetical protein